MRSKALLVGGTAGFEGPHISLDGGVWVIRNDANIQLSLPRDHVDVKEKDGMIYVRGPVRFTAKVADDYTGPPIHLDAKQVSRV